MKPDTEATLGHPQMRLRGIWGIRRGVTGATRSTCFDADSCSYGQENDYNTSCSPTYKFTGYEYDSETGNYYAYARYYSPRLGRFMTADPLGGNASNPQSLNRYSYVVNNPTSLMDSSGMLINPPPLPSPPPCGIINPCTTVTVYASDICLDGMPGWSCTQDSSDWIFLYWDEIYDPEGLGQNNTSQTQPQSPGLTKTCNVSARVLQGNPAMVGFQGGIPGVNVQAGSAAVVPSEFGVSSGAGLAPYALQISGNFPTKGVSFQGVTDVIGSKQVPLGFSNIRQFLEFENPGQIIIELPTGNDLGPNVPAVITVPAGAPCPIAPPVIGDLPTGPTVG